jgi:hypothetical protein
VLYCVPIVWHETRKEGSGRLRQTYTEILSSLFRTKFLCGIR